MAILFTKDGEQIFIAHDIDVKSALATGNYFREMPNTQVSPKADEQVPPKTTPQSPTKKRGRPPKVSNEKPDQKEEKSESTKSTTKIKNKEKENAADE